MLALKFPVSLYRWHILYVGCNNDFPYDNCQDGVSSAFLNV